MRRNNYWTPFCCKDPLISKWIRYDLTLQKTLPMLCVKYTKNVVYFFSVIKKFVTTNIARERKNPEYFNVKCYPHLTLQDSQKHNMIITLIDTEININNYNFYCYLLQGPISILKKHSLLIRKNVTYKIFLNGHEKQLSCPMLKFPQEKNVVLWPSIKLPNRKYPIHTYIYAAALYLSSGKSMRDIALKVRQKFGLESFSHSTKINI